MTRSTRKSDETWAIQTLLSHLQQDDPSWQEATNGPTDRPDVVLVASNNRRVACEITQVDRSEWLRWQNDKSLHLGLGELDEAEIAREVDIWLINAIKKKQGSAKSYVELSSADECWLLVHGGLSKPHDLFVLDEEYDIPLLVGAARSIEHSFARIYVCSVNTNSGVMVFPHQGSLPPAPDITDPAVLRMLTVRSRQVPIDRAGGVLRMELGADSKMTRSRTLPLLDKQRMKQL